MAIYKLTIPSYSILTKNKDGNFESRIFLQNETFDENDIFPNDMIVAKGMNFIILKDGKPTEVHPVELVSGQEVEQKASEPSFEVNVKALKKEVKSIESKN